MFWNSAGDLVNLGIQSKYSNIIAQKSLKFTHQRGALGRQFRTEHSHLVNEINISMHWLSLFTFSLWYKKPLFISDNDVHIVAAIMHNKPELQCLIDHVAS